MDYLSPHHCEARSSVGTEKADECTKCSCCFPLVLPNYRVTALTFISVCTADVRQGQEEEGKLCILAAVSGASLG